MERLTENSRTQLLAYLAAEPEYNIFIIGDLYNFGFDDPAIDFYAQRDRAGNFLCVLMRFHHNYVFYSHALQTVDITAVVEQISNGEAFSVINGKQAAVELLVPHFPKLTPKSSYLAALRQEPVPQTVDTQPVRLVPDQAREIIDLYVQTKDFGGSYMGREDEEAKTMGDSLQNGGRCYGIHRDSKLVAVASTAAENDLSAMIIGVCTHPDYRGKGYASALVAKLCYDCMSEGLHSLCLFYYNPAAGRIYRRIGFVEMGQYMMLVERV